MKSFALKALLPTEDDEQACLIQWAGVQRFKGKSLVRYLIMIPNGAHLAGDARARAMQMAKMKRMGFRNGTFDLFLAVPRGSASGLWIEMKRRQGGVISEAQTDFAWDMGSMGYAAVSAKGWEAAKAEIEDYLGGFA